MNWRQWPAKWWDALNAGGLVAVKIIVVALLGALLYNYFHAGIVIRPISVPTALRDEGVTDVVAADELRQRIYVIRQNATFNANTRTFVALSSDQPDIDIPTTSISMSTLFDVLASVLPYSPRTVISGEFTGDASQLKLVVLLNGKQVYEGRPRRPTLASADDLLAEAAHAVVTSAHPDWEALALDHAGKPREADQLMDGVISRASTPNRDVAEAHLLRGMFLRDERQYAQACAEFNDSLALNPANPDAYQGVAALLEDERQFDAAAEQAQKAVMLSWGRSSWDYYALGTGYYLGGQLPNAEHAYRESIRLWPGNSSAHDALGLVKRDERDYRAALSEFNTAIALDGSFVDARDDRGTLLINKFKNRADALEEAREDFAAARAAAPAEASPELGLAYVDFWRKKYEPAANHFLAALRRRPSADVARLAYGGAISSVENSPWAAQNRDVKNDVSILTGIHACAHLAEIPAVVGGQTILHALVSERCRMDKEERGASPVRLAACRVRSDGVALLPGEIMFYSFGIADRVASNGHQVAASMMLVVVAGFALLGWRSLRRTVRPNGRGTASDTDERTGPREPEE